MKTYKILKGSDYKFLIETEDEVLLSPTRNPADGEPFYEDWTTDEDTAKKYDISLLVTRIPHECGGTGFGYADNEITSCFERDGKLFITTGAGEYVTQVNFCPFCGYKAEIPVEEW